MRLSSRMVWIRALALLFGAALGGCAPSEPAASHITPTVPPSYSTAVPTATGPASPLDWVSVTPPPGYPFTGERTQDPASAFAASPSDGLEVYACDANTVQHPGRFQMLRSDDAGATWRVAGSFPIGSQYISCYVSVASNDPNSLLATASSYASESAPHPDGDAMFISADSGATWHALGQGVALADLSTFSGGYYAVEAGAFAGATRIVTISPAFAITGTLPAPGGVAPSGLWVGGGSGQSLLVSDQSTIASPVTLWTSSNGGATWSRFGLPEQATSYYVAQNAATTTWRVCGADVALHGDGSKGKNWVACTVNDGLTWTSYPTPVTYGRNQNNAQVLDNVECFAATAISGILAVVTNPTGFNDPTYLDILYPNATHWTVLGKLTTTTIPVFTSGPRDGMVFEQPFPDLESALP